VATQKRSISFDEAVLAEAERLAGLRGGNLSALVNAALERELRVTRGHELLAADEAELGSVPDSVRAQIADEWPA
jgi:Arc/MetJ family transcription regulator